MGGGGGGQDGPWARLGTSPGPGQGPALGGATRMVNARSAQGTRCSEEQHREALPRTVIDLRSPALIQDRAVVAIHAKSWCMSAVGV